MYVPLLPLILAMTTACRTHPTDIIGVDLPVASAPTVFLRAFSATSGRDADRLLDGDAATTWSAEGDPEDEAVAVRFADPVAIDAIAVTGCPDAPRIDLVAYLNGAVGPTLSVTGAEPVKIALTDPQSRELSDLRLVFAAASSGAPACLAEVGVSEAGAPLTLRPPRTVRGRVRATSVREPSTLARASLLFDGRSDRGWIAAAAGEQRVLITFDEPTEITGIEIDPLLGGRSPPSIRVEVEGRPAIDLPVDPLTGARAAADLGAVTSLALTLAASDAPTGLGEIRFIDRHGPYGVRTPDDTALREAIVAATDGTPLAALLGHDGHSVCGFPRRRLKIRASGTLSALDPAAVWGDGPVPVAVDADWSLGTPDGPWLSLHVDGRAWSAGQRWDTASAHTRPFAGDLAVARVADLGQDGFRALVDDWTHAHPDRVECLTEELGAWPDAWAALVDGDAFVVRGEAWSDLMWHELKD